MAQYTSSLFEMTGQVSSYKPNARKSQIQKDINARIRRIIDYRPFWSAMISKTVINIPNAYSTGGVTFVSGSAEIVGVGTSWPVADAVDTTSPMGIRQIGYQEITPASMINVNVGDYLYVSDGIYSEVLAVTDVTNSTFTAEFRYPHNDGFTITKSTFAGLQLQLSAYNPIYTLKAVTGLVSTDNTGIIDMEWGGASTANAGYRLLKAYVTIDPNIKDFLQVWDPTQGIPLAVHLPQDFLSQADPQRQAMGNPQCLVDLAPNEAGVMQYELWPYQNSSYSIPVLFYKQWPELRRPTDKPPWFINPSVIIDGAIADALRRKDLRTVDDKDPYYDLNASRIFEDKYKEGLLLAASADESKALQALTRNWSGVGGLNGGYGGGGAAYQQSHVNGPGYDGWGGW